MKNGSGSKTRADARVGKWLKVVYPGTESFPLDEGIEALAIADVTAARALVE